MATAQLNVASIRSGKALAQPSYAGTQVLTAAGWASVLDNPRQRDTATRAGRAKHLRALHPAHSVVNMGKLPNGDLYKLDGHTRSYLWQRGEPSGPAHVFATTWDCANIDQIKELYGTFDNKAAAETVGDQVFGAVNDSHQSFISELMVSQRFAGMMRLATEMLFDAPRAREQTVYQMFEEWLPELRLLDACNPGRRRFSTGVGTAAILTLRRYGPNAQTFWTKFSAG